MFTSFSIYQWSVEREQNSHLAINSYNPSTSTPVNIYKFYSRIFIFFLDRQTIKYKRCHSKNTASTQDNSTLVSEVILYKI